MQVSAPGQMPVLQLLAAVVPAVALLPRVVLERQLRPDLPLVQLLAVHLPEVRCLQALAHPAEQPRAPPLDVLQVSLIALAPRLTH